MASSAKHDRGDVAEEEETDNIDYVSSLRAVLYTTPHLLKRKKRIEGSETHSPIDRFCEETYTNLFVGLRVTNQGELDEVNSQICSCVPLLLGTLSSSKQKEDL